MENGHKKVLQSPGKPLSVSVCTLLMHYVDVCVGEANHCCRCAVSFIRRRRKTSLSHMHVSLLSQPARWHPLHKWCWTGVFKSVPLCLRGWTQFRFQGQRFVAHLVDAVECRSRVWLRCFNGWYIDDFMTMIVIITRNSAKDFHVLFLAV